MMRMAGRGTDGKAKALTMNEDNRSLKASPGGVEEIAVFDYLEIRDTNNHNETVDLSKYNKVRWKVISTLDQPVKLFFSTERKYMSNSFHVPVFWNGTEWESTSFRELDITEFGRVYDVTSKLDWLKWGKRVMVTARTSGQPTTGALTIIVEGVLN